MTVLTGCMPGFLFRFADILGDVIKRALPVDTNLKDTEIRKMVSNLLKGVADYTTAHPELSFEDMATQVATRGGLTEAGLCSMEPNRDAVVTLFQNALTAANKRGDELAQNSVTK